MDDINMSRFSVARQ